MQCYEVVLDLIFSLSFVHCDRHDHLGEGPIAYQAGSCVGALEVGKGNLSKVDVSFNAARKTCSRS
jgi:hypothetical protein